MCDVYATGRLLEIFVHKLGWVGENSRSGAYVSDLDMFFYQFQVSVYSPTLKIEKCESADKPGFVSNETRICMTMEVLSDKKLRYCPAV